MADLSGLGEALVAAAVSGGGSFLAALRSASKKYTKIKEAVDELEEALGALKKSVGDQISDEVGRRIDGIKTGLRFEVESYKRELQDHTERRIREIERQTSPGFNTLEDFRRRIEALERALEKLREEPRRYVTLEAFNDFTTEQNEKWNEMNRDLGQIMGALKIRSR